MADLTLVRNHIQAVTDSEVEYLRQLNLGIHSHPETAHEEVYAHEILTGFLESRGFNVTRQAYGLSTAFEAEIGTSGPIAIFCAEYDALPKLGHACGHNLIATSSTAAFLGLAQSVKKWNIPGRVRILGTPAEEAHGGKIKLIAAGAFSDPAIAAAIMVHPTSQRGIKDGYHGTAGWQSIANSLLRVEFHGKGAHAGGDPWNGVNALDAAVSAYSSLSMLRQHIQPDERIHGIIEDGGKVPNIIPDYTRMQWSIRSRTAARTESLLARVKACFEAAGAATGCSVSYVIEPMYQDIIVNDEFCQIYTEEMAELGRNVQLKSDTAATVSTDMGNVSHVIPSFHGVFGISTPDGAPPHHAAFAKAAGSEEAYSEAMICGKAMAMLGWRILTRP
ncbi:hypothetical protein N8T08_005836 [Aspergillus melleus]|uniref:Uncharacterized protein n=1 Tax=Aspergillus melleus TaxID=138277 RepID=A0ACC3B125_9EURO|nr:hypothetical protein N8T08_005836 [Aspergillus melleus]